jgi:ketosteroid isomerase-like protein
MHSHSILDTPREFPLARNPTPLITSLSSGFRSGVTHNMKPLVRALAIALCALTPTVYAQTSNPAPDAANIIALERMWNQAQVSLDAKAIASMIGDRFINTEYDGEVSNRGKFLADFADPQFKPTLMNIDNVKVEMYPNTAIVTGNYHVKGVYASKPYEHFGRFTDTWILQDGKWLCVASHSSLVKK